MVSNVLCVLDKGYTLVVRMGKSFRALRCRSKSVDQRFPGYHAKCTVLGSILVMNGATMFCQRSKSPCEKPAFMDGGGGICWS